MTDIPEQAFIEESAENLALGAAILEEMIRESVHTQGSMPPAMIFDWYAHNVVYRFIQVEHLMVYGDHKEHEDGFNACLMELGLLIDVLNRQKMFGLQHKVSQILRTRTLKLPPLYDATLEGKLPI